MSHLIPSGNRGKARQHMFCGAGYLHERGYLGGKFNPSGNLPLVSGPVVLDLSILVLHTILVNLTRDQPAS